MTEPEPFQVNYFDTKFNQINRIVFREQTGCFAVTSSRKYMYIEIMYGNESNTILSDALKRKVQDKQLFSITNIQQYFKTYTKTQKSILWTTSSPQ